MEDLLWDEDEGDEEESELVRSMVATWEGGGVPAAAAAAGPLLELRPAAEAGWGTGRPAMPTVRDKERI